MEFVFAQLSGAVGFEQYMADQHFMSGKMARGLSLRLSTWVTSHFLVVLMVPLME